MPAPPFKLQVGEVQVLLLEELQEMPLLVFELQVGEVQVLLFEVA